MKKCRIALLWIICCIALNPLLINAQQIVVGQPMPDFVLHRIQYYPKKEASLKDFRGKWLLLDLWDKGCGACIAGFPRNNNIQQQLGGKLQVMLVGLQDKEGIMEPLYKGIREKEHLMLPCAFDSVFVEHFAEGVPNAILIDDKGIVRCWSINLHLDEVRGIMAGQSFDLATPVDYRKKKIPYDLGKPFLVDNNGASSDDFMFRSVLSKWDRNIHNMSFIEQIDSNLAAGGKLETLGSSLEYLYELAYWGACGRIHPEDTLRYGRIYHKIILQLNDSSLFDNAATRYNKNLFSYSLILPKEKSNIESMQRAMQEDLKRYFGFEVVVERKKCPYYKLIAGPDTAVLLHITKQIPAGRVFYKTGFIKNDIPFKKILNYIRENVNAYVEDATGIQGNINIDMDCNPSDVTDLQKALKRNGLDLVSSETDMEVITIKNPKTRNE